MAINTLTDSAIKAVKVSDKPVKLFDGAGLFVLVKPTGAKYWRLKYRHGGLEKTLALGVYPEVSLKRGVAKENTFAAVAEEWFAHYREHREQGQRALSRSDDRQDSVAVEPGRVSGEGQQGRCAASAASD